MLRYTKKHYNVFNVKLKKSPSKTSSTPSKLITSRQGGNTSITTTNTSVLKSSTPSTSTILKEPTSTPPIPLSKLSDNSLSKFHHQITVIVDEFIIDSSIDKFI